MTEVTENRALIVRGEYDLTVPERALIGRGLLLAESLGKKEFTCPILGAKFVLIPAGKFMMGSPENEHDRLDSETLHQVTISKSFFMQTTPVTQGQWQRVMGNNPSYHISYGCDCPVEMVSWNDVQDFIKRLNRQEGTDKYRLPTGAEWKYAARAGTTTRFYLGDNEDDLSRAGWHKGNSGGKTHPVGQKIPNAWGLYDMHGNVWEWVQSWYGVYTPGPEGPISGLKRIACGGSIYSSARDCRSAADRREDPAGHGTFLDDMGFRLLALSIQREIKNDSPEYIQYSDGLKKLIKLGEEKGFVTYDEVNDLLPNDIVTSDQIDEIIEIFFNKNIDIIDTDKGEGAR